MQLDRISLALQLIVGSSLIVTYRARPPADFWCKNAICLAVCYSPSPQRRRESCIMEDFSHVQVLSAAGWTDWITVSRDLKKTQWTSNRVLGPLLWTALAMEVTNHWMYRGRRLRVLVCGYIYLYVCLSMFCVYRYKLCGWWVHANMHICEPVWACGTLAPSTLQKKSPFFIFLSLLNLPTSLLWSSPWQSCLPVALNSPGSYNTQ